MIDNNYYLPESLIEPGFVKLQDELEYLVDSLGVRIIQKLLTIVHVMKQKMPCT